MELDVVYSFGETILHIRHVLMRHAVLYWGNDCTRKVPNLEIDKKERNVSKT
jgi:hypothetical protein